VLLADFGSINFALLNSPAATTGVPDGTLRIHAGSVMKAIVASDFKELVFRA